MNEENNPAFIGRDLGIVTVQDGTQISTEDGVYVKMPVLNSIANKMEVNDETHDDNHVYKATND